VSVFAPSPAVHSCQCCTALLDHVVL
jgi:hypothetical protein